jgi:hypothetical protein
MWITAGLLAMLSSSAWGLTAYNCEAPGTKRFALDTRAPAPCPDPVLDYNDAYRTGIQLIHRGTTRTVAIDACRVTVSRLVTRCGYNSISYGRHYTVWLANVEVSPKYCATVIARDDKFFEFDGRKFNFTMGRPQDHQYFSRGHVDNTGYCRTVGSASFTSGGKFYTKSYEETFLHLDIRKVSAVIDPATDSIETKESGDARPLRSLYRQGSMIDAY